MRTILGTAALLAILSATAASAADLVVRVDDGRGHGVADAVVAIWPRGGVKAPPHSPTSRIVDQNGLTFVPYLSVFRPGDQVVFRNSDRTRHHVYSFSPVKAFEFVLAPHESSPPQRLDRLGAVAVGCNIHDRMIAYLYVTDAPWFAQSDASGQVRFEGLVPGLYEVRAWHPRLRPGRGEPRHSVGLEGRESRALQFSLPLFPDPRLQVGREQSHY